MSTLHNFFSFAVIAVFLTTPLAAEESGRDIMLKIDNRHNGNDRSMKMTMTLINKKGKKRVREMVLYSKDYGKDSKSLFYFEKPADVKGTGFLSWSYDNPDKDDDSWLYLPSLKRSRRISGASKNDSFMGSDMSYDDMGNRSVDEDNHRLLKEEEVDGFACWVIESTPKDKKHQYSKMIQWYRKDALLNVKGEFYDKKGVLLKTLKQSDIRKVNGIWVSHKTVVENVQHKHKTELDMSEVTFDTGLKDNMFKVATLERGRPQ
jgi:outer membrane lipoprotein-sorting protein